jgi:uncharacterized protein
MKVVLDTNVLVSGIFFGGIPGKILDAWANHEFDLFLSPNILHEYIKVIHRSATMTDKSMIRYWVYTIAKHARHIPDTSSESVISRDPHDDKFLWCATAAKAQYLVTGDKDLTVLEDRYDFPFKILSPRSFVHVLSPPPSK